MFALIFTCIATVAGPGGTRSIVNRPWSSVIPWMS
jgi:hypothetical protein